MKHLLVNLRKELKKKELNLPISASIVVDIAGLLAISTVLYLILKLNPETTFAVAKLTNPKYSKLISFFFKILQFIF